MKVNESVKKNYDVATKKSAAIDDANAGATLHEQFAPVSPEQDPIRVRNVNSAVTAGAHVTSEPREIGQIGHPAADVQIQKDRTTMFTRGSKK